MPARGPSFSLLEVTASTYPFKQRHTPGTLRAINGIEFKTQTKGKMLLLERNVMDIYLALLFGRVLMRDKGARSGLPWEIISVQDVMNCER